MSGQGSSLTARGFTSEKNFFDIQEEQEQFSISAQSQNQLESRGWVKEMDQHSPKGLSCHISADPW